MTNYQPSAYKGRRIEMLNAIKFQHKLNRILFWVVVLLIILFIAVFLFLELSVSQDALATDSGKDYKLKRRLYENLWNYRCHGAGVELLLRQWKIG